MKFLASVLLIVALVAPTQAAVADDKAAATQVLLDYLSAFTSEDARRAARYCQEPLTYVGADSADVFDARADIEIVLKSAFSRLKKRGWARSRWPQLSVKLLSNGVAVASLLVVHEKTDGQELERSGVTYLLRKGSDGWKIAVIAAHDASNVLKLD